MSDPPDKARPGVLDEMRRDWDRRARENARYYIASGEDEGVRFALSGCRDAGRLLEDLHEDLRSDMRVLEIGCGIGRLLQYMALIFEEVHGIDVSAEMIEEGRRYLARHPNAHLEVGDGASLAPYPDAHFDLVYSYVVFQHIPDKAVIESYVTEARRVLRPGGLFKYLVKTESWEGATESDTWHGVNISEDDLSSWNERLGFELVNAYSEADGTAAWVIVRAPGTPGPDEPPS